MLCLGNLCALLVELLIGSLSGLFEFPPLKVETLKRLGVFRHQGVPVHRFVLGNLLVKRHDGRGLLELLVTELDHLGHLRSPLFESLPLLRYLLRFPGVVGLPQKGILQCRRDFVVRAFVVDLLKCGCAVVTLIVVVIHLFGVVLGLVGFFDLRVFGFRLDGLFHVCGFWSFLQSVHVTHAKFLLGYFRGLRAPFP